MKVWREPDAVTWRTHCLGCGKPWGGRVRRDPGDFRICTDCDAPWSPPPLLERLAFWFWSHA